MLDDTIYPILMILYILIIFLQCLQAVQGRAKGISFVQLLRHMMPSKSKQDGKQLRILPHWRISILLKSMLHKINV